MTECSKCGKEAMTFTCKYCGKKFCSEHRLPENHECESMEEEIEKEREKSNKWFKEKEVRNKIEQPSPPRKPSMTRDVLETLKSNATVAIIALTVFSFMLQAIPGYTELLLLDPALEELIRSPWSVVTVMLVHGGYFHIFANMVTFYFFGTPLERATGARKLLKFYILSGVAASLGYILFRNLIFTVHGSTAGGLPVIGSAVGASGAVVAVFAAVAMLYPEAEVLLYFFIPMKIRTALYLFGGIEAFNVLAKTAGVTLPVLGNFASSAHLTGLIIGVWYGRKLREKVSSRRGVLELVGQ